MTPGLRRLAAALCAVLWALGSVAAQAGKPQVIVWSTLPAAASEIVSALCRPKFADRVRVLRIDVGKCVREVRSGRAAGHIAIGLTEPQCRALAADGWLSRSASDIAADLGQSFRDPDARYFVPLRRPIVIGARADFEVGGLAGLEGLLYEERLDHRIALPHPDASPELWSGLVNHMLASGRPHEYAFQWLRTLDHQSPRYLRSFAAVAGALVDNRVDAGLIPLDIVDDSLGRLRAIRPSEGMPAVTASVARVATANAPPETEAVYRFMGSADFARGMADAGLLPVERAGLPRTALSLKVRELDDARWRYPFEPARASTWIEEWRKTVEGVGSRLAWWDQTLQLVLFALFAVALYFIYRRMQRQDREKAAEDERGSNA